MPRPGNPDTNQTTTSLGTPEDAGSVDSVVVPDKGKLARLREKDDTHPKPERELPESGRAPEHLPETEKEDPLRPL